MHATPSGTALVAHPDVLIIGGTTAAVAAAVALAEAGRRVTLATPRTAPGEDIASFLRLAEPPGALTTVIARRLFGAGNPTPMHVRETLERELLHAGVELLYGCHPGGVLCAPDGRIVGAALLNRAGRHAVRARTVIDATWTGLVARQADCAFRATGPRVADCAWTFSAPLPPPGAEAAGSLTWRLDEHNVRELPLWTQRFKAPLDPDAPATLAAIESGARLRYFRPDQSFTADNVFFVPARRIESGHALSGTVDSATCDLRALLARPGLWVLSPALDADDAGCAALLPAARFIELGRRLGVELSTTLPAHDEGAAAWRCRDAHPVAGLQLDGRDLRGMPAAGLASEPLPAAAPLLADVDVLVVGAGTAGAPAGIAAGREGRRTLAIEACPGPGGVGTWGQIAKYYAGHRDGFTREVDTGVAAMGTDGAPGRGSWRVEWKRGWWSKMLAEAGTPLWQDTLACGVQVTRGRVSGVLVAGPCGFGLVRAACVVDATGAADLAAAAGAETLPLGAVLGAVQGTGLSPREPNRDYANSDHTFTDDGDVRDVTRSFVAARRKFRECFDLAPIVSSRERRRVAAEAMVQPEDIFAGRSWPDAINLALSSFDTHGFTLHPMFKVLPVPRHIEYRAVVPLRALLPRGIEGLLVLGLGMGAHRDAMPVLRMQPCLQNQGFAAGLVAAAAAAQGVALRALKLRPLQERLIALGILDTAACAPDSFPAPDAALETAVAAEPPTHHDLALVFAHANRALPRLRTALASAGDDTRRLRLARILGLLGDPAGNEVLAGAIDNAEWDTGWNYRGMDQFGASFSPLDTLLWAAAGAPAQSLYEPVLHRLEGVAAWPRLTLMLELSHAQSISAACAALTGFDTEKRFNPLLARVLTYHQVAGNHQSDWDAVMSDQPRSPNHTEARNRALRELTLAAGLLACGDFKGMARTVLERYALDWRGPLAHYAQAVLAGAD